MSATMARVTRSRRPAAAKALDKNEAGSASDGSGRSTAVEASKSSCAVGVERHPGGLVEGRHPAQVAGLGRFVDVLEEALELAEPGLRPG